MTQPSTARPHRSRGALVGYLVFLALLAWQLVGGLVGTTTPLRFLRASWAVATGGDAPGGTVEVAASDLAFRPFPYVMYALKPSFTRRGEPVRSTNALGFRGPEIEVPKPAGRYRIVCLGGSTTYSNIVGDDDTYPRLMEGVLRELRPDLDVEVVNAGVESYTSAESLANLAFRCLDLEPDAIVVYHGANDYRPRVYPDFDSAYAHYRAPWDGSTAGYRDVGGELGGINFFIQHPPPSPQGDKRENLRRSGAGAYRRNLISIAGVAAAHGVDTYFVTFEACAELAEPEMMEAIAEHNEVVREVCRRTGAVCIELEGELSDPTEVFGDSIHLHPPGQRAKVIRRCRPA